MTVLSAAMGFALPNLLPKQYTHYAAALLFLYFGVILLRDAKDAGDGVSDELAEVEEELIHKKDEGEGDGGDAESGNAGTKQTSKGPEAIATGILTQVGCYFLTEP